MTRLSSLILFRHSSDLVHEITPCYTCPVGEMLLPHRRSLSCLVMLHGYFWQGRDGWNHDGF